MTDEDLLERWRTLSKHRQALAEDLRTMETHHRQELGGLQDRQEKDEHALRVRLSKLEYELVSVQRDLVQSDMALPPSGKMDFITAMKWSKAKAKRTSANMVSEEAVIGPWFRRADQPLTTARYHSKHQYHFSAEDLVSLEWEVDPIS